MSYGFWSGTIRRFSISINGLCWNPWCRAMETTYTGQSSHPRCSIRGQSWRDCQTAVVVNVLRTSFLLPFPPFLLPFLAYAERVHGARREAGLPDCPKIGQNVSNLSEFGIYLSNSWNLQNRTSWSLDDNNENPYKTIICQAVLQRLHSGRVYAATLPSECFLRGVRATYPNHWMNPYFCILCG